MIVVAGAHLFEPSRPSCEGSKFLFGNCGLSFAGGGFSNGLNYGSD